MAETTTGQPQTGRTATPPNAARKPAARRSDGDATPVWKVWMWGGIGAAVVLGLFFMVWRSQFAAAQTYLFDTRSAAEESGYCLAVAQDVFSGGPPVGSYVDEASKFWLKRLRGQDAPMGPTIVLARKRLSESLMSSTSSNESWMANAMDLCSRRAVMYGMKFRAFE